MSTSWRTFFGFAEDNTDETYPQAVQRAKRLLQQENYEDACRILRYAERQRHAEAMYLLAWCFWYGRGVREDAGKAMRLWKISASLSFEPAVERVQELKKAKERCGT